MRKSSNLWVFTKGCMWMVWGVESLVLGFSSFPSVLTFVQNAQSWHQQSAPSGIFENLQSWIGGWILGLTPIVYILSFIVLAVTLGFRGIQTMKSNKSVKPEMRLCSVREGLSNTPTPRPSLPISEKEVN